MMRIAFDHQIFCRQTHGGISRYFAQLARQFVSMGQDVCVFAPLHRNRFIADLPDVVVRGRFADKRPPATKRLAALLNPMFCRRSIRRWGPDLVHETYYAQRGSGTKTSPVVVTVYDMIHELFGECFSRRDRTQAWKRVAVERADRVICISHSTRRDLLKYCDLDEDKVSVIHLGFERFGDVSSPAEAPLSQRRPFLLFVGSREGYKNFGGLLRAVAASKRLSTDFDIVAFGGQAFGRAEVELIANLRFRPGQVRQVGGGDTILGQLYDQASAFVYPSLYEGFGLPPLEAMAHDCPVISSNTSSMPEVIGNAGAYFDPASVDDMTAAIQGVVYSTSIAEDLVARGRDRLRLFSWQECATRTLDVYRSLVAA